MAEQMTLPAFIERENVRIVSCKEVATTGHWQRIAWHIVLRRKGGKQLSVPIWGHGGGLGRPEDELPSVVASLITDAQVHESCGMSVAEYESDLGKVDEEDYEVNRGRIREILAACQREAQGLKRWLGEEKYRELLYEVEGY
jgi:hypothetical protein